LGWLHIFISFWINWPINQGLGDKMVTQLGPGSGRKAFLEYEVAGSLFAQFVWWDWGQNLFSSYLAKKTNRKYERYLKFTRLKREIMHSKLIRG